MVSALFKCPSIITYAYIMINCIRTSPLDRINPPMTRTASKPKDPTVFATIRFLPSAPINRKSPDAIWLIQTSRKYCLRNLPYEKQCLITLVQSKLSELYASKRNKTKFSPFKTWIKSYDIISHHNPDTNF